MSTYGAIGGGRSQVDSREGANRTRTQAQDDAESLLVPLMEETAQVGSNMRVGGELGQRAGELGQRGGKKLASGKKWGLTTKQRFGDESAWRLIDRRGDFSQATGAVRVNRLGKSKILYMNDAFHSLLNTNLRTIIILFSMFYLLCVLFFALVYMVLARYCGEPSSFNDAWAFSIETIMTIGYSLPDDPEFIQQCTPVLSLLTVQTMCGLLLDAVAVGLVYARLARGQARANTVVFSDYAIIRRIDGRLRFMFQVAEMRKHQLLEAHVRCYAITRHKASEDLEDGFYFRTDALRLSKPDDELGGMLFMALPNVVVHDIDQFSALKPRNRDPGVLRDPSAQYCFPDPLLRECDVETGSRDRRTKLPPVDPALLEAHYEQEEAMIRKYWLEAKVEVAAVIEGVDPVTSDAVQARHSYCASDIKWHHNFVPCAVEASDGSATLDFTHFHDTTPLQGKDLDAEPIHVISNS